MTGQSLVSQAPPDSGRHLSPGVPTSAGEPGALCSCGCGARATKASGYRWGYWHDPSVSVAEKKAVLQLGGRRGALAPAEVEQLLEDVDLTSREGRHALRDRFLRLRLAGRVGVGVYRDLLAALDSAAKDVEKHQGKPAPRPVSVEVARFGANNHEAGA